MNKSKQAAKKMLYFLYQILDAVLINKYTITKIVTKSSFQILPAKIPRTSSNLPLFHFSLSNHFLP